MITVGSCFSGIGGIELGLEWTGGFETKWQIENDPASNAVLKTHWPHVVRYGDIKTVDEKSLDRVGLICGGYPCQPFSLAGKRVGEKDPRHLWPDMFRIIRAVRPKYILLENVPGHLSMGFGRVLGDLATSGYDAEWQVLSAAGVGAPHLRRRLFIVAHANSERQCKSQNETHSIGGAPMADAAQQRRVGRLAGPGETQGQGPHSEIEGRGWWSAEPNVGRMAHGVPARVDRLRCLGNSVVPQVAAKIGRLILEFENGLPDLP